MAVFDFAVGLAVDGAAVCGAAVAVVGALLGAAVFGTALGLAGFGAAGAFVWGAFVCGGPGAVFGDAVGPCKQWAGKQAQHPPRSGQVERQL